ncbi:cytochrome c oxidase subunit II [Rubrimonas cliftonensis]|uniref:Cytochrome c oxidase subunit 2 n=1 Tax=Rubrimonas cliftonensis TaxID=89524 RepID=A0A1H4EW53_9RHOB|nr:cytochrome c oxidase subunit II [Rubrimonas cliftonensis]SEA89253.1 cytochrome c oxidase subunit 2 [Rubrimonas cliftonensis]
MGKAMFGAAARLGGGLAAVMAAGAAVAQEKGLPMPEQIGFQPAATELARDLHAIDDMLLYIIGAITLFVTGLLLYCVWRFRADRNPTPARFTHNATVEVIWTAVPVMILVAIAFPSLNLLYKQLEIPEAEVNIKAIGNQWYWSYEYSDYEIDMDAIMVGGDYRSYDAMMADEDGAAEAAEYGLTRANWLLKTDTSLVVPVNTVVRVQTTANDVIHAWTVPAFGVKMDAVPGRLNELWFAAEETGVFYGQCSELCGTKHAYMPITVEVVTREQFDAWVEETRLAQGLEPQAIRLAQAD